MSFFQKLVVGALFIGAIAFASSQSLSKPVDLSGAIQPSSTTTSFVDAGQFQLGGVGTSYINQTTMCLGSSTGTFGSMTCASGARLRWNPNTVDLCNITGGGCVSILGTTTSTGSLVVNGSLTVNNAVTSLTDTNAVLFFTQDSANSGRITGSLTSTTATSTVADLKLFPQNALDATDLVVRIGNAANAANLLSVAYNGALIRPSTDQSADCDNAATGNAPVGKVCVQAGQGSMVLTNSLVTSSSIVHLTNISDDGTCISGYATVGSGTVTIGCVGAGVATANTVFAFQVTNQ